jgi:hypothetical protein
MEDTIFQRAHYAYSAVYFEIKPTCIDTSTGTDLKASMQWKVQIVISADLEVARWMRTKFAVRLGFAYMAQELPGLRIPRPSEITAD